MCVLPCKAVTVCKPVGSFAVPKALVPFAFISVPVGPLMHPVSMSFILMPLPDIGVSVLAFPNTMTMLKTLSPLAIVCFTVIPRIETLAIDLTVGVVT